MPRPLSFLRKSLKDAGHRLSSSSVTQILTFHDIDNLPARASTIRGVEALTTQQRLPYELLLHILSYVKDRNDILTLCRSSKAFRSIAEDFLYRVLDLDFSGKEGKAQKAFKLLQAIQNPRFLNVVTELRVDLRPCTQRVNHARGDGLPIKCTCGTIDQMLGIALRSMRLLEVLRFTCSLCMNLTGGRHHYFPNLGTLHLRELCYECNCTMGNGFDPTEVFQAPWMQSVTSLDWQTTLWTSISQENLSQLLRSRRTLPNLDTLRYSDSAMCNELLAKRPISRLCADSVDLVTIIDQSRKNAITHLILSSHSSTGFFTGIANTSQFLNLQHIGTLGFYRHSYGSGQNVIDIININSSLDSIAVLKHLVSINTSMTPPKPHQDPLDQQILARLETAHPRLRRVYISGVQSCVWVLGGTLRIWEKHSLPLFTSWDILTGRYDKH